MLASCALLSEVRMLQNLGAGPTSWLWRRARGVALLKSCYQVLENAEQRIEILTSPDGDGNRQTMPIDVASTMERQEQRQSATPPDDAPRRSPRDDASSLF